MKGKAMLAIGEKHMQTNSRDGPVKSAGRETDTERLGGEEKKTGWEDRNRHRNNVGGG